MIQNIQIAILKKIPRRQTPCLLWLLKMYHDATLSVKKDWVTRRVQFSGPKWRTRRSISFANVFSLITFFLRNMKPTLCSKVNSNFKTTIGGYVQIFPIQS